jgi:hypothetical protein
MYTADYHLMEQNTRKVFRKTICVGLYTHIHVCSHTYSVLYQFRIRRPLYTGKQRLISPISGKINPSKISGKLVDRHESRFHVKCLLGCAGVSSGEYLPMLRVAHSVLPPRDHPHPYNTTHSFSPYGYSSWTARP